MSTKLGMKLTRFLAERTVYSILQVASSRHTLLKPNKNKSKANLTSTSKQKCQLPLLWAQKKYNFTKNKLLHKEKILL